MVFVVGSTRWTAKLLCTTLSRRRTPTSCRGSLTSFTTSVTYKQSQRCRNRAAARDWSATSWTQGRSTAPRHCMSPRHSRWSRNSARESSTCCSPTQQSSRLGPTLNCASSLPKTQLYVTGFLILTYNHCWLLSDWGVGVVICLKGRDPERSQTQRKPKEDLEKGCRKWLLST